MIETWFGTLAWKAPQIVPTVCLELPAMLFPQQLETVHVAGDLRD